MPVVQVIREGENLVLPLQIDLNAGESVEWRFPDLSLEEIACIHFYDLPFPESEPYGPFQCLEPSSFDVRGLGNTGRPGDSFYTAFVLTRDGVAARSDGQAKVVNHSATVDTSPGATIHYDGTALHVEPQILKVDIQRPALWYMTGIPAAHFVTFQFDHFHDAMVGPFSSFQVSRGLGTGRVAIGSNFTGHSPEPGHENEPIRYHVRLRRPDGTVLAGEDPVIEPPPGWPPNDAEEP